MENIKVGLYGATGYTGLELVRLIEQHPQATLSFVTSESQAGSSLRNTWPTAPDILLQTASSAPLNEVDCVFLCLPHTQSARFAAEALKHDVGVVDLSADLRLDSLEAYEKWYGVPHPAPELLPVPYGLPELGRSDLHGARVIANPGCYATAILLSLAPLLQAAHVLPDSPIIIDAKSGTSGAGRSAKQRLLFGEIHGNFSPYNIGRTHRHLGEIEQVLAPTGLEAGRLVFSPHLLPTDRGILAAIYIQVDDAAAAIETVEHFYTDEPLIDVLPRGELATLAHVVRTPKAALSLTSAGSGALIVMAAIDNLLKGAASQAVQNFNLMHHLPETLGLLAHSEVTA